MPEVFLMLSILSWAPAGSLIEPPPAPLGKAPEAPRIAEDADTEQSLALWITRMRGYPAFECQPSIDAAVSHAQAQCSHLIDRIESGHRVESARIAKQVAADRERGWGTWQVVAVVVGSTGAGIVIGAIAASVVLLR